MGAVEAVEGSIGLVKILASKLYIEISLTLIHPSAGREEEANLYAGEKNVKTLRGWYWMPILAFALAVLSIVLLIWIDRFNKRQQSDFELADVLMDIQISVATSHFRVEEAIAGYEKVNIQEVDDHISPSINLAEAILTGGKSEHGQDLQPLRDSKLRKRVEEIKLLLIGYKTLSLERMQDPEAFRLGSVPYKDFDALFFELQNKTRALEMILEKDQIQAREKWRHLYNGIHLTWSGLLFISMIYFYSREVRRRNAEKALQKANKELRSLTEELRKHKDHLAEEVEGRTAELSFAIGTLQEEIVKQKQTEESLRTSENKFRTLVENLPQKIFLKNKNSVYIYCNENYAKELSIRPDEITGRTDYDILSGELAEKEIAEDKRILETGKPEETEERHVKNGLQIVVHKFKVPIENERGEASGVLGILWDITERVRLESIAEAANTMNNIGYVFSGIRHELGNPINTIKMTLGLLENKIDTSSKETIKKYIEWTAAEVSRVDYLLKALKNFNMYETPEIRNVPMKSFLDNFLSLVANDFEKKGIRIESLIHPGAKWGYIDPRALQQVMLNIVNNASDALEGRENPIIAIDVLKANDRIRIRVSDNGSGMSEEQQKDLFKPFRTTKMGGTGLGLVIAKKMLTGMKGSIEIRSLKGEGTTVDISIPEGRNVDT